MRDEIEHLLDDNEDMSHLYLTRKLGQHQQSEALIGSMASNNTVGTSSLQRFSSVRSGSVAAGSYSNGKDVEDLEMLLEAYFMQLDGTRNKILSVSSYASLSGIHEIICDDSYHISSVCFFGVGDCG